MSSYPIVYVVDDDALFLNFTDRVLRENGYSVQGFQTGEQFLGEAAPQQPGCAIVDIILPGMQGTDVQIELNRRDSFLSVVAMSGAPTTDTTVQMMKRGAVTLLQKPLVVEDLLNAVRQGIAQSLHREEERSALGEFERRLLSLSENERQVMDLVMAGQSRKAIIRTLEISSRTFDRRQKNLMEKMQTRSVAELVAKVTAANYRQSSIRCNN